MSQIALDDLIAEFSFICSSELNLLQTRVFKFLSQAGVNPLEVEGLRSIFSTCTLRLCGLTTPYLRDSYIQKHFGLVVSLFTVKVFLNIMFAMVQDAVERRLGRKWVRCCVGARVCWSSTWDRAYDVPLLQSLQKNEMKR